MNPLKFFDLPIDDAAVLPEIVAKWIANSPLAFVGQYASNPKKCRAIMMDVGLQENLVTTNKQMDGDNPCRFMNTFVNNVSISSSTCCCHLRALQSVPRVNRKIWSA
jgi:hypothetical protein